jgi:hypothetical protein
MEWKKISAVAHINACDAPHYISIPFYEPERLSEKTSKEDAIV